MKNRPNSLIHIVTLGCARNDTDSELLAGRLLRGGMALTDDPERADVILVNTCGFIEAAKKDSIDVLLSLADVHTLNPNAKLVATGCLAQRYGDELAAGLPELDAVLGFADYDDIAERLRGVIGRPESPATRPIAVELPAIERARLDDGPYAPLKIAAGCDRRCAFCAIPSIRGAYRSRPPDDIVAEARWLVAQGVKEIMLVSENSTSYGKDLGDRWALPQLLRRLGEVDGLAWVRVSYLQPAEITPQMLDAMATTPNVVPYFDLSFQHASGPLLRRMRRFGDAESFLGLLDRVRERCPSAGVRTSVIVGFPGETRADVATLHDFLGRARADAIGVFGFSDEEGTEAHGLGGHLPDDVIDERVRATSELAGWLMESRAAERIGERVLVLVESVDDGIVGRAAQQGPEVDDTTSLDWPAGLAAPRVGDIVAASVTGSDGVDLIAVPVH
ncbi:MAG: 30S ribosomal protein S12 methylthiotransferase RimO [Micrococcales bacterium]|nr:30S ribosomal protein S12 methylthiotransferase RimO [Micrococcales bacterium]